MLLLLMDAGAMRSLVLAVAPKLPGLRRMDVYTVQVVA